ncbi:MAG: phage protease [Kiritimatiellae bacterium]|nr:phage protease [Kiritimatiellia bacterium]
MKDASGHEHDDKGLFTGSGGGGVTPAAELKKKSTEELTKINPWDDEKTRKMKMKLAKMHEGNQAIKDDIAKRKAHIAEMKKSMGINAAPMPPMTVLNSAQSIPDDGLLPVQVAPFGDFKGVLNKAEGKKEPFVQHLDADAFSRIVEAWNAKGAPEILIDADHVSAGGSSTRAFGWARNLRVEDAGLFADFALTPLGRAAVENREYRFVSPVFSVSENGEIASLTSIALTNKPNLPVACVLNSSESGVNNVGEEKEHPEMDEIKNLLGLGADATPEDVAAAVKALQQKVADADAAALNAEAEKCADENADKIENRKDFVDLYVKNGKEVATAFLAALKTPAKPAEKPAQTVLNANAGTTPTVGASPLREGLAKCKNAAERAAYVTAHAAEFAAEGK